MGNDPFLPWFIILAVIVAANLVLASQTQRRLKEVSPEGWIDAGSWSLVVNNSLKSTIGFTRFVYGKESYGDAKLHRLKWALRVCHVVFAVLFAVALVGAQV